MTNKALDAAVAASVAASTEADPDTSSTDATDAAKGSEGADDKDKGTTDSTVVSTDVQTPAVTDEQIAQFREAWGVDLSLLPDEASRGKFLSEWSETQKTIGKLQREKAELAKTPPATDQTPTPAEETLDVSKLSDEQLAQAIGINFAEADERDMREIAYARLTLEQADRLERLEKGLASSTRTASWDKSLDALEAKFGNLPGEQTRADLFAWAEEQGVDSPEAAYWAAAGPVRALVADSLNQRIIELRTDGKKGATTVRPRSSADTDEGKLTSTNVKDGIKEAFERARAAMGAQLPEYDS